jgi:signal transduction histidine kinase
VINQKYSTLRFDLNFYYKSLKYFIFLLGMNVYSLWMESAINTSFKYIIPVITFLVELEVEKIKNGTSNMTQLTITDTGLEINPEIINSIFMSFYSTKSFDSEHIGFGFSISYNIIKKNNGNIEVKNTHPLGYCFVITLPQKQIE